MVETNEANVNNITENTTIENITTENKSENTSGTAMTEQQEGEDSAKKESTTTANNILHSVSIDNENFISSKRIIQIIGGGDFKKQNKQENDNDNENNNNNLENSKINDDDNNDNNTTSIIYEFDATTEDPFTLESFDTLIQQHAEKDKDFIIARVTTVNPSDESKTYHSFYSGHHINKVLFRTQPDQGLLHRMKAKNPLNNMNIVGDVYYYVVKAANVKKSQTFAKSSSMSTTSRKTLKVKDDDAMIVATSSLDKDFTKFDVEDIRSKTKRLNSAPPSIWNFENGDDEEKVVIEMELSENIYTKRWSADDSIKPLPKAFTANHSFHNHNSKISGGDENLDKLLTTFKLQPLNNNNNNSNNNDDDNNDNIVDGQSSKAVKSDSSSPPENNITTTISHSSTKESSSPILNEDDKGDKDSIYYKAIFYATDDDFLMRSAVRQFFKSNALDPTDAQLFIINTSPHNNPHATTAINGATPSVRLERMVTNNGTFLIDPMIIGPAQTRRGSRSVSNNDIPTSRWRRMLNNLRMNKGLRWLVLMYMIFGFLLIRFVVSETYAYLMAFLLMLCLFLVFCVGSGVGVWGR